MSILAESIYTNIIVIVVSIITLLVVYLNWAFRYWNRKGVASPSVTFPFGNAKDMILQKHAIGVDMQKIYDKFKPQGYKYCGYYFLTQPQFVVFDLELVKSVMTKDFMHFTDHGGYVNEEVDPLSGHLFSLRGLKWKNLRAKLTPTFTSGKMKMMFQTLVNCSDELVVLMDRMIKEKEDIDIKEVVGRFTTDIIGSCAFGIECNSLKNPDSEFRRYGRKIFEMGFVESLKNAVGGFFPGVLDFFRIPLNNREVSDFLKKIVEDTVNYRERNNIVRKDFMHLLIQLKNNVKIMDENNTEKLKSEKASGEDSEEGKSLNMNELTAQAFVFFAAGFETSSTTLTFCFYELVLNSTIQDKVREEIKSVLEKHDGKLSYNAIMEMTYMEKCINETLRKYPPLPILTRECTKSYKVPNTNVTLDKGMLAVIPILGIQHDPEYYPDPEKFDPERFSSENKSQRNPYAWLPFGEGPRACIGLRFGIMQTKVALAVLLGNYRFTLNSKTQTPLVMDPKAFVPTVEGGVWLNAEKIHD